ncbi:MAG: RDD family protein [Bacteriovorax sp.]|nr:RDD family protein [Bacteriovorax sp.]
MTDSGNPTNSNENLSSVDTDNKCEEQDWEFSIAPPKIINEVEPTDRELKRKSINHEKNKSKKLVLDEESIPKSKTRSAMAQEVQDNEEVVLKDIYSYAPLHKRALAFILDIFFLGGIYYIVNLISPILIGFVKYFINEYKFDSVIPETFLENSSLFFSGSVLLFFFVIIPVSFYNSSFGKMILGLKVRGAQKYTISISEAIKREFIFKPISIVIIAGFVTPFISSKRLSIHDMIAKTFVIEE